MARTDLDHPIVKRLDAGSEAFAATWRRWVNQWTQPKLLRLSETYLGARMFHSSQMAGFATRRLQNPAPKAFLAIGALNLAHARSLGLPEAALEPTPDLGLPRTLPGALRPLWDHREPIADASGIVLGPVGLFEAFCGLRELPAAPQRSIPSEAAPAVCEALGKHLRLSLAQRGRDWLTELPELSEAAPSIEPLLKGHTVAAERLLEDLPAIAALLGTSDEALWQLLATYLG